MLSSISRTTRNVLLSTFVMVIVMIFIIITFLISGNQELLNSMLQGTVKGEVSSGLAIFAVGPFAIWLSTFIIISLGKDDLADEINLTIEYDYENVQGSPPTKKGELEQTTCFYSIYNGNKLIRDYEEAIIQFEDLKHGGFIPYISVDLPSVKNPLYKLKLRYNNGEWVGTSYSIKKGRVKIV